MNSKNSLKQSACFSGKALLCACSTLHTRCWHLNKGHLRVALKMKTQFITVCVNSKCSWELEIQKDLNCSKPLIPLRVSGQNMFSERGIPCEWGTLTAGVLPITACIQILDNPTTKPWKVRFHQWCFLTELLCKVWSLIKATGASFTWGDLKTARQRTCPWV